MAKDTSVCATTLIVPFDGPHYFLSRLLACETYRLPENVAEHVDIVVPTIHFDAVLRKRGGSTLPMTKNKMPGVGISPKTTGTIHTLFSDLKHCDQTITPVCLRALYGLVYEPLSAHKNSFGIG